jgi:hypothetical protein
MAKKKAAKRETKSEFLRKVLSKDPDLEYDQVLRRWARAGHAGEISSALYYKVRAELGIKTVWMWMPAPKPVPRLTGALYQFRITLLDVNPPVWRRIQVHDGTLDTLHEHIQTSMGWTNSHLHHFRIGGKLYGDPMLMEETFEELNYADSTTTLLSDVLPKDGKPFRFEYEYDFGDGWQHEILFEGNPRAEPGRRYPLCLEGQRACPPDDVGGAWGYIDFVAAITDPEHEEHDEMREWVGRDFDPEAFDPAAATRAMKRGLPDWRQWR